MVVLFFTVQSLFTYVFSTQIKEDKITAKYLEVMPDGSNLYSPLIRLEIGGDTFCSGVVIDGEYALTAAHCVTNMFGKLTNDKILVQDEFEMPISGIEAEAVALDKLRDIALIKGNFIKFQTMQLDYYTGKPTLMLDLAVVACGFPSGGNRFCSIGVVIGNETFKIRTRGGMVYKGMSGGPVVDLMTERVIGVNSAAYSDGEIVAPVVGAFEQWGI